MALLAFNIEIAKIAEVVSEPILGQIRLQWWREAIDEIYQGHARGHGVVAGLARSVQTHGLSRVKLDRMIDARALDLEPTIFPNIAALEAYVSGSTGALSELSCEALGASDGEALGRARHAGLAWGLTGLLRALPHHAAQRRAYMPKDHMDGAGITAEQIFARSKPTRLPEVIEPVAAAARAHMRAASGGHERSLRAVFLPMVLTKVYLDRLEGRDFDLFAPGLEQGALARQVRLTWAAFRA